MSGFFFMNSSTNLTSCSQPMPAKRIKRSSIFPVLEAAVGAAATFAAVVGAVAGLTAAVVGFATAGAVVAAVAGFAAAGAVVGWAAGAVAGWAVPPPHAAKIGAARATPALRTMKLRRVILLTIVASLVLSRAMTVRHRLNPQTGYRPKKSSVTPFIPLGPSKRFPGQS